MAHFALDPNMTEADWDAARKLAGAQQEEYREPVEDLYRELPNNGCG